VRLSTRALATAAARHPWRTVAAWAAIGVLAIVPIAAFLADLTPEGRPTNEPQSQRALDAKDRAFPGTARAEVTDLVVIRSDRYAVDAPQFRAFVRSFVDRTRSTDAGASARSYLDSPNRDLVSRDRDATLVPLALPDDGDPAGLVELVERADAHPPFAVSIGGERTLDNDFNELSQEDLKSGELQFGIPAAIIILLLVFGSIVAGLVPLLTALVSILVALGLVALLGQAFDVSVFAINILTGMGLALGIDYALFVVSRYREERGSGRDALDAIGESGATASRAVLFSGVAFVVAMFGMLLVPNSLMRSLAAGAILVGLVSVAAALTLLPALLGLLGDRVDSLRIPFFGRRALERSNPEGRFWRAVVRQVLRRPGLSLALSVALLLGAASPILGMDVGTSRAVSTLPDGFASKEGFIALHEEFPNASAEPVEVVVDGTSAPADKALRRLRTQLESDPRFGTVTTERSTSRKLAVLSAPVRGDTAGDEAIGAVEELRADVLPSLFSGTGADVFVGGTTSEYIDYRSSVSEPAPLVFALVLGLTLVLLTLVFRSIVVAATAVILNLLSVGAAYGLLVLVFQHGVGTGLLGFQQADTIEAWVPLFLFSVLFGLSMDYQVFLLSRIQEHHTKTGDTAAAVSFGVSSTARIITGAALIIVAVFAGFARGELIMFQQMGFGVAVALLLDATIIRSVVLPSAMKLLGSWNWYLPRWLEWLPQLQLERASSAASGPSRR
jgi:uncharacterized membrane protein YdfJ with MMPL/SSD domain